MKSPTETLTATENRAEREGKEERGKEREREQGGGEREGVHECCLKREERGREQQ